MGTICKDKPGSFNDTSVWIYPRGSKSNCEVVSHEDMLKDHVKMANKLVFVFQTPLPRDGMSLDYSRWQQNLIGVLQADIVYNQLTYNKPDSELTLDLRLAYRNNK